MPRPIVPGLAGPDRLAVGDTYSRPATVSKPMNNLDELGSALQNLNPVLSKWYAMRSEEDIKNAREQGLALAEKNRKDWNTAIKDGSVPAGTSPWTRVFYEEQYGKIKVRDAYPAMLEKMRQDESLISSDNPAAINEWLSKEHQALTDGLSPEGLKGATGEFEQLRHQMTASFLGHRAEVRLSRALDGLDMQTNQLIDSAAANGMGAKEAADQLNGLIRDAHEKGNVPIGHANQAVVKALLQHAEETGDSATARAVMENMHTPGGTVADTTFARDGLAAIDKANLVRYRQEQRDAKAKAKEDQEVAYNLALASLSKTLQEKPESRSDANVRMAVAQLVPQFSLIKKADQVQSDVKNLVEFAKNPVVPVTDNPEVYAGLGRAIHKLESQHWNNDADFQEAQDKVLADIFTARSSLSPDSSTKLIDRVNAAKNTNSLLNHPEVVDARNRALTILGFDPLKMADMKPDTKERVNDYSFLYNNAIAGYSTQYSKLHPGQKIENDHEAFLKAQTDAQKDAFTRLAQKYPVTADGSVDVEAIKKAAPALISRWTVLQRFVNENPNSPDAKKTQQKADELLQRFSEGQKTALKESLSSKPNGQTK